MMSFKLTRKALLLGVAALTMAGAAGVSHADDKATGKGLVIGWTQRGLSGSDWWKTMIAGAESQAQKIGAELIVLDANGDTTRQNQDVQTLISRGADVVVINANDPIGVAASVKALKKAGIPLVAVNSNLDDKLVPDIFCYVAEDQVATGALAGKVIGEKAIEKFGTSGNWKLGSIGGFPGDVISDLRFSGFMKGFNSVVESNPGIKVEILPMKFGEWKPDKALTPIRDMATANPDMNILFSMSDVMNGGITQGLKQAGSWGDGILIGSYDGGMAVLKQMMDDPKGPMQAVASNQPWDQAVLAVKMAVAGYNKDDSQCPNKTNYVQTSVVTPDTAAKYYKPEDTYMRAGD
ncbi:MAG: sugar ABC transporter substrate-binding protein [Hyphomicrobiales bacterium]|nr:sugar ABC transporter substrate-binding protein [Hyphomicrobiales bacterium]